MAGENVTECGLIVPVVRKLQPITTTNFLKHCTCEECLVHIGCVIVDKLDNNDEEVEEIIEIPGFVLAIFKTMIDNSNNDKTNKA